MSTTTDANLDFAFVENALPQSLILKSQQNKIELVTRPWTVVLAREPRDVDLQGHGADRGTEIEEVMPSQSARSLALARAVERPITLSLWLV